MYPRSVLNVEFNKPRDMQPCSVCSIALTSIKLKFFKKEARVELQVYKA